MGTLPYMAMHANSLKPEPGSQPLPLGSGAPRKRVLFVDDEEAVLDGLRAVLRPQRREWDMVFALGGPAALAELEQSSFDVVITDMRMPILDGAQLLRHVKGLQPRAVRLVLSGQIDSRTAFDSVFTAHQFLAKPCDPEKLRSVVKRCCDLNELLAGNELRSLAGDVGVLPAAPTAYLAISEALADPECGIGDVARIVEREPALCAKVLQVANSAFFGLPRTVSSATQAATYLGTLALRDLALAMEMLAAPARAKTALPLSAYKAFQLNALGVALLARSWFTSEPRKADDAFVAGMLRDMGHLVLAARRTASTEAEQHAALSAYLLALWGIPHGIMEAVAYHEHPERIEHDGLEVVDVVHLADRVMQPLAPSPFQAPATLDEARISRLGVSQARLTELKRTALRVCDDARKMLAR
jgi:HD-like signal output (HDOD) protein